MTKTEEIKELTKRLEQLKEELKESNKSNLDLELKKTGYNWIKGKYSYEFYKLSLKFTHPCFPRLKGVDFVIFCEDDSYQLCLEGPEELDNELDPVYTVEEVIKQFLSYELVYYQGDLTITSYVTFDDLGSLLTNSTELTSSNTKEATEIREPFLNYCKPLC